MTQDLELHDLMQSIASKSLNIIEGIKKNPPQLPELLHQYIVLLQDFQSLISALLKNPEKFLQMQIAYMQDAIGLAQDQFQHWLEGKSMPIQDKRFSSEEWINNPFFNLLSQHYLLATEHMNSLLEQIDYGDPQIAKRIQFFTRQYLDALSPANFLHTNPQLLAETLQTHGKNLLRGLKNFLSDIETGSARLIIKMTDTDAFAIGENLATTPGKVIYRNDMMELIQYFPQSTKVKSLPLLIIPPWINKYYILDLSPQNSLIGWLVKQGITVFVISWVNPDASYAQKSFYHYLNEGPHTAIEIIKKQLAVEKVNALGFCIGGTLLASLLAYNKARSDDSINSATFLASMIDFSDPGDMAVFIGEQQIQNIEEKMRQDGYLAGRFMASSFNSLRANDLIWSFFIKNYLQGKNPVPFDILYWNADSTNMPATMHSQYLRWMYLHNDLVKPGKIKLNNVPLDVTRIDTPSFFVSTIKDHIAPWQSVYAGFKLLKGPKRFILGGSGHIAGIINPPSANKYNYYTNQHAPAESEKWLKSATEHGGSWWQEWITWLKRHSGRLKNAPEMAKLPYQPMADAPGEYVLKKS
ncbi:class I poly(R)-hydroxyalkanoic acid synthase [Legionella israelensis]|uniref:PHA/PHB synthase family protein n=1 Tax=Legionella israelensis TaxID=454 RepID=UPI00117C0BCB|nr:class I poly(R)-hydroxyalkanoic acid synthase [Legionella israelensis]QDP71907.1 class I poly(R)-hydroxyalkanoic acid synthase [Legionella israelensis]